MGQPCGDATSLSASAAPSAAAAASLHTTHAGRVRASIAEWRRIGAPRRVLSWLEEGVRIPWVGSPPPPFHHGVSHFAPAERAWLTLEARRCLATGAWCPATQLTHVSRAFVVYHNSKPRFVVDLRHINSFCQTRSCRYETLTHLRHLARRDDWLWSVDLTDAYHHVPFHPECVHYFTFGVETLEGVRFCSTPVLNFGWTLSPFVFTKVMRAVTSYIRRPHDTRRPRYHTPIDAPTAADRLRSLSYLDDFAFLACGRLPYLRACELRDRTLAVFRRLGLATSPDKVQQDPSHVLQSHLGFTVDSTRGLFLLTPKRTDKLRATAHQLLLTASRHRRRLPARRVAGFAD